MLPITTCFVAGLQYLIHPLKLGTIQETINPDALIPITLLTTEEIFGDLEGILNLFDSYDDVFVPDFGSILVEKTGDNSSQVRGNTRQVYHMDQIKALDGFSELPSGPYFLYGPNLHQAWRLYDDEFGAFTVGVVPDDLGKPDDRAWKSLYKEASSSTAKYAQELLDQGAVIIGKTKTSQFGTGAEWIDQQAPWSARGDGYHSMKGGSVGAAAALTGYPWLDHSIGVDGKYLVSTKNHTDDTRFNKTRLLSRTLKGLLDFTSSPKSEVKTASPTKIIIPIDLISPTYGGAMNDFVSILENHLNVKADHIEVGKVWESNPPVQAKESMQTYMAQAPFRSWCYDYYHAFDEFRVKYRQKFHHEPFAETTPQYFWDQCKDIKEEHREDTERLEIYRRWFDENILRISTPNSVSDAIIVLPCGNSQVEHRNEPVAPPTVYKGIDSTTLAPVLGASLLSFPSSTPRATSPAPQLPLFTHSGATLSTRSIPTSKPRVLHIGDPIKYNPETYLRFSIQCEIVRPSTEERQRPEFIKSLKEKRWGDFDAIFRPFWGTGGEMGKWDDELICLLPRSVKVFASAGAGFDWANTKLMGERGIIYCNSGLAAAEAVADFAIAAIVSTFRVLPWCISSALSGDEETFNRNHRDATMQSYNLRGRALGLVGFGNIGQQIAARARHGFGMNIHYYDILPKSTSVVAALRATHHETLESLLAQCDCVVLCTPAGDGTLINATTLPLFKSGARFVNIARGSLVDEDALVVALREGPLSNAALDVHANEPKIHPGLLELAKQGRVMLTCHNAGGTVDTHKGFEELSMRNIMAVLSGGEAITPVNLQFLKK
ncbi:hypothetical protein FGRMN_3290 [Fusarium graminum]|nr:hypothetical protein FGRMN_3290 [Fusarium graminum]